VADRLLSHEKPQYSYITKKLKQKILEPLKLLQKVIGKNQAISTYNNDTPDKMPACEHSP